MSESNSETINSVNFHYSTMSEPNLQTTNSINFHYFYDIDRADIDPFNETDPWFIMKELAEAFISSPICVKRNDLDGVVIFPKFRYPLQE